MSPKPKLGEFLHPERYPTGPKPKRYVVRTGLFLDSASGKRSELVFCSSGESGWLLPVEAAQAKRAKCGAWYLGGDLLRRGSCGEPTHQLISLDHARSKGVITPRDSDSVSLPLAALLRAWGLRVSRDWRAA